MSTLDMLAYDSTNSESNSELGDLATFNVEEDYLSVTSHESEISATHLATDIEYAVIWEILNGCQEAAFADIPGKYRHCLSIFSTRDKFFEEERSTQKKPIDDEVYDTLFEVAGATKTSLEPWSLPSPVRPLSHEDVLWRQNVRVLEVSQVHPTAAIYLALDHAAVDDTNCPDSTCDAGPTMGTFEESMSPLVHATAPRFASAVFISASHTFPYNKNISFQSIRRYSRLATTSLLRQTHALHIDTPVFGILLRGHLVAIHVDWCEEHDDTVESFSAFYPIDDEETDIKTWNLNHSPEKRELLTILSNLQKYTYGRFASQVRREVGSVRRPIKPWRWDASCLSHTLSPAQLGQHSDEPSEDKIDRWQRSLRSSKDQATSRAWLKQQLLATQLVRRRKDFLSPPSTPGDITTGD